MPKREEMAHLLVVDDDPLFRGLMCDVLAAQGFRVTEAPDGRLALEQIAPVQAPDALITDLQMPGIDGVELI